MIDESVPDDGLIFGYHIPQVSGVPLPPTLLKRLAEAFPTKFAGVKDSSGDLAHAQFLAQELPDLLVMVGNDKIFTPGLQAGVSGCITSGANLWSPLLRLIWESHQNGDNPSAIQEQVNQARAVLDSHPPASAFLKAMLAEMHDLQVGTVRPPLLPIRDVEIKQGAEDISAILESL